MKASTASLIGWTTTIICLLFVGPLFGQVPQIAYFRFDEGQGAVTANFASGAGGGTGTLTDASAWDGATPFAGASSWSQPVGANSYVTTPITLALSGDFTIEFAVRPEPTLVGPSPGQPILRSVGSSLSVDLISDGATGWRLGISTSPAFGPPPLTSSVIFQSIIPSSQWTFCTVVYDGLASRILLYLNGIEVESVGVPHFPISIGLPWTIGYIPSTAFPFNFRGSIDEFRFWTEARTATQIRLTAKAGIYNRDIGIGELIAPAPRARTKYYSTAELVTVEVVNVGSTDLQIGEVLQMDLTLDGQPIASEFLVLSSMLPAGGAVQHTFGPTINLSGLASHNIALTVSDASDQQQWNNSRTLSLRGGGPGLVTSFPWSETFDVPWLSSDPPLLEGWLNSAAAGNPSTQAFVFPAVKMNTQTNKTPPSDHTSKVAGVGRFAGLNTAIANGVFVLETPAIDLSNNPSPVLTFFLHQLVAYPPYSTVTVEARSVLSGQFAQVYGPYLGAAGTAPHWERVRVPLASYFSTNDSIAIKFIVNANQFNDVGIDDITVHDESVIHLGQAPSPSFASLNISDSLNANKWPVSSGQPGPYECIAVPSSTGLPFPLVFSFEGEPNQPVALLGAGLNLQVGTYPGFGQLDIGGPLDLLTGLPTGLVVHGSGFVPLNSLDQLFFTDSIGTLQLGTSMPMGIPLNGQPFQTFQALVGTTSFPFVRISNAVLLRIWGP